MKLSKMTQFAGMQHVSVIFDPLIAREKIQDGELVVYGDAVNEPNLLKAHVNTADIVLISVGNLIPAMAIVEKVRQLNRKAYIIARVRNIQNVEELYKLGADQVLPEKLEIAIDMFNRVLVKKLYPQKEINRILTHIRNLNLGEFSEKDIIKRGSLFDELPNTNISSIIVDPGSGAKDKSIAEIQLRNKTGSTILAIKRGTEIIEHPEPHTIIQASDIVYVLGNPEQNNLAFELLSVEV